VNGVANRKCFVGIRSYRVCIVVQIRADALNKGIRSQLSRCMIDNEATIGLYA